MLNIENLSIDYDNKNIITDFNLHISKGKICVILGHSGCGKTSILNAIGNLINFTGKITLNNKVIDFSKENIGYLQQNYELFNFKTIYENITFGAKLKQIKYTNDEIEDIIYRLKIKHCVNMYPKKVSGGERQRAALARTIVMKPEVMLLDEPFSALDYLTKEGIQQFFLEYIRNLNSIVLIITHNIEEAVYLGDEIIILNNRGAKHFMNIRGLKIDSEIFHEQVLKIMRNIEL